jgi:hypothetical protein
VACVGYIFPYPGIIARLVSGSPSSAFSPAQIEITALKYNQCSCWGPSAYEGPQKQDLTVFLEYNV